MTIEAVLEQLVQFGEDDWIGLWLVVAFVAEDLEVDDPEKSLELTIHLVKGLLERGFRAGHSPVQNGVHFAAWADQDLDTVADFIRRQWAQNPDYPSWGDEPWFAASRFCRLDG